MEPVQLVDRLSAAQAAGLAHVEVAALGLPDADVVSALAGERAAHFVVASGDSPAEVHT